MPSTMTFDVPYTIPASRPARQGARLRLRQLLLGVIAACALLLAAGAARADVILHAFNWRYADVAAQAAQIQQAGYRIVLVAPAYRSQGSQWWARYQPQDYRVIDSPLGNTSDFRAMVQALNARGIRTYADVLLNHMANETAQRPGLDYPGPAVLGNYAGNRGYYDGIRLFGNLGNNFLGAGDFNPASCIRDYNNVYEVQTYRICGGGGDAGLPDLAANAWVIAQQQAYLRALKALGVTGFRIDAAKHMPFSHLNAVLTPDIKNGVHVFGELITSGGAGSGDYDTFLGPYLQNTDHSAYDFPLFNSIRGALGYGGSMNQLVDPGAYGQALPGSRAVTFAVTHDIPNNDGFRYLILDPTDETLAYAYLMGRNGGVPMVYSDHNESGDNRWVDAWKRSDIKQIVAFHNAAQGSDMQVLASASCYLLYRRGDRGIVGINKCGSAASVTVGMNNSVLRWNTNYIDVLDAGSVVNITNANYTFTLPARRARMWLR